jgi:hypothetical protein
MPTIRDLVYLNRDLRKTLQTVLSTHRSPIDGRFWPIVYLTLKIMKHHEALELLAGREYGSEAGILIRSMFEAVLNLLWISHDVENRLKRYVAYQIYDSQKYRYASTKWNAMAKFSEDDKKQIEQNFEQLSQQAHEFKELYGFKSNKHWSGKSLREMAKEVGWLERYDFLYIIYSDIVHSNVLASNNYISFDASGMLKIINEPQIEHCKACLTEAYVYLLAAFSFLDVFLDLNMESIVDKAYLRIPKV